MVIHLDVTRASVCILRGNDLSERRHKDSGVQDINWFLFECGKKTTQRVKGSCGLEEDYWIAGVENDRNQDAAGITQSWVITDDNSET